MSILQKMKQLFKEKNHITTFIIEANSPKEVEVGSVHEDNKWFHGTKFEILTVSNVEHNPKNHWPYAITGTCKVIKE